MLGIGTAQALPASAGAGDLIAGTPNPGIKSCPAKVGLVYDLSGSIGKPEDGGNAANVRNTKDALKAFARAFEGTPVAVRALGFASYAPADPPSASNGYNVMTPQTLPFYDALFESSNFNQTYDGTNHHMAFQSMVDISGSNVSGNPEAIVFVTDGVPTYAGTVRGQLTGNGSEYPLGSSQFAAVANPSIFLADILKNAGTRIIPVAVKSNRLFQYADYFNRISGPNDTRYIADFPQLAGELSTIARQLCTPEVPTSTLNVAASVDGASAAVPGFKRWTPAEGGTPFSTAAGAWTSTAGKFGQPWNFGLQWDPKAAPNLEYQRRECFLNNPDLPGATPLPITDGPNDGFVNTNNANPVPVGGQVFCRYFFQSAPKLITPSVDETVRVRDVETGQVVNTPKAGDWKFALAAGANNQSGTTVQGQTLNFEPVSTRTPLDVTFTQTPVAGYTSLGTPGCLINGAGVPGANFATGPNAITLKAVTPGATVVCTFQDEITKGLKLQKTEKNGKTTAKPGDTLTYVFKLSNTGSSTLKNVAVTDELLGGAMGTVAQIAPGQTVTLPEQPNHSYKVPANASGIINNKATAAGQAVDGRNKTVGDVSANAALDIAIPAWTLTKTADKKVARVGDTVTYTMTVKNTGAIALGDVPVVDSAIGFEGVIKGPIAPGESKSITATHVLTDKDFGDTGKFINTACTKADGKNIDSVCGSATVWKAGIELTKTGPATILPGNRIAYEFTVKNTGAVTLTDVVITDQDLPVIDATIELKKPLAPGETSDVLKVEVTFPADFQGDSFTNTATVTGTPIDPETQQPLPDSKVTDEASHTVKVVRQSLEVTKTVNRPVAKPGDKVTWTITVKNTGSADLTNVTITDPTIGFTDTVASLKAGESQVRTVEWTVPTEQTQQVKNVATACAGDLCADGKADLDIASLKIVKAADKEKAEPGDKVSYTFDVTNTGSVTLTNVDVTDDILGEIGTIATLAPGDTTQLTKDYTVPKDQKESVVNTATACAAVPTTRPVQLEAAPAAATTTSVFTPLKVTGDAEQSTSTTAAKAPTVDKVCATDSHTLLVGDAALLVTKKADRSTVVTGDLITYTYTVKNVGTEKILNVKLVDDKLGDIELDKTELNPGETATGTAQYTVKDTDSGDIVNVATVTAKSESGKILKGSVTLKIPVVKVGPNTTTRPDDKVSPAQLPFTGSSSLTSRILGVGLVLLGIGALFVAIGRKPKFLERFIPSRGE
ncbi:MAG: DUF7507 domain-containing protein [Acidimicrobiia bacterium]